MAKNIMYVAGYVFWDAFYTVANVPYGSMLPLITEDAQLSSLRSAGAMIAAALGYVAANGPDQSMEVATKMRYLVAYMYLADSIVQFVGIQLTLRKKELAQMRNELHNRKN